MNTRFTIEEENIVAIYAEDSRETTLENILAAMPYMDEDMRQLAAAAVNMLSSSNGPRYIRMLFIIFCTVFHDHFPLNMIMRVFSFLHVMARI